MKKEMKTSVKMIRLMDDMEVIQRTKDGYFEANDLLTKWNSVKDRPRRQMSKFMESPNTKEYIERIKAGESPRADMLHAECQVVEVIKGRNTSKGRSRDSVWMHPYLFIDFAMWINPTFKYEVVKFVYDRLIEFRINVGGGYKNLSSVGSRYLEGYDFALVARAMNHIVFGKEGKDLRQTASQEELKELDRLQDILIDSIEMGTITTFKELIENLQRRWCKKNGFDFQEEIERIEKESKRKKRK